MSVHGGDVSAAGVVEVSKQKLVEASKRDEVKAGKEVSKQEDLKMTKGGALNEEIKVIKEGTQKLEVQPGTEISKQKEVDPSKPETNNVGVESSKHEEVKPESDAPKVVEYQVYPTRWLVLATVCLLALSNGSMWVAYAPLSTEVSIFYCDGSPDCEVVSWTSQIFQAGGFLFGILGMYITDKYGVKVSTIFGTSLNFVGGVIRIISSIPAVPMSARIPILYLGQSLASVSQPFFLVLSPKVAEFWFPEDKRALANVLSFIANPAGVCTGALTPALAVGEPSANFYGFLVLNCILGVLALICFVMSLLIPAGKPPTPPSASSVNESPPFFDGLKQLVKVKSFYIQWFTYGMSFAVQWSLFFCTDAMVLTLGYHGGLTAYLICASAIAGCVTSILAGMFVDKYKRFNETIKALYVVTAVVAISICFLRHDRGGVVDDILLFTLFILLGAATIPMAPVSMELIIETTFPIAEATSTGALVLISQLLLFLLQMCMVSMPRLDWIYSRRVIKHEFVEAAGTFEGQFTSKLPSDNSFGVFIGKFWATTMTVSGNDVMDPAGFTGNFTGTFNGNWTDHDKNLEGTFNGSFVGTSMAGTWNYQLAVDFWTLTAVISTIFACTLLWPKYKRLEFEKQSRLNMQGNPVPGNEYKPVPENRETSQQAPVKDVSTSGHPTGSFPTPDGTSGTASSNTQNLELKKNN